MDTLAQHKHPNQTLQRDYDGRERRDSTRELVTGPVWFRGDAEARFQSGWLLEQSAEGAAFLTRDRKTVLQGTRLQFSTYDPTDVDFRVDEGLVSRVNHVHADLYVIAVQFKPANRSRLL